MAVDSNILCCPLQQSRIALNLEPRCIQYIYIHMVDVHYCICTLYYAIDMQQVKGTSWYIIIYFGGLGIRAVWSRFLDPPGFSLHHMCSNREAPRPI